METNRAIADEFEKAKLHDVYKIIVADDNPIARLIMIDMIQRISSDRPIDIREAKDGRNALQLFTMDGGADLLVTDCEMPEKNGYELTKDIRDIQNLSPYNKNPLIVMMSSLDDGDHILRARESGVDYVYTKGNVDHMDLLQGLIKEKVSQGTEHLRVSVETQPKNFEM